MKNIYKNICSDKLLNCGIKLLAFSGLCLISVNGFSQQSYTFTNCGATGQNGPTQLQVTGSYALTNLNNAVTINTLGIQQWTVPNSGAYRIEADGAQGGVSWGLGARMIGDFTLTAGTVLKIVVGQLGGSFNSMHGSGGGGSFVVDLLNNPMVVAGGGGGRGASSTTPIQATSHGTTIIPGQSPPGGGPGGTAGGGGAAASGLTGGNATTPGAISGGDTWCSGGGGFLTNGGQYRSSNPLNGGRSFFANALGGDPSSNGTGDAPGGFGGGGGSGDRGAGGGGYSGGGGGTSNTDGGGGGGSYNNGANQVNTSGVNAGHGKVIITVLCAITVTAITNPICFGNSATLTTNAISNYAWSTGGTSSSIIVSPTVNTTYTLTATSPSNCTASAAITVTVDNTPTVSATISSSVVCLNKAVVMTAIGANTYTWSSGATNGASYLHTAAGNFTHTVTGTNACGNTTAAVVVTVNPIPNITASINTPTVCNGNTVVVNGFGSAGGYTWSAGASNNSPFVPPATNNYVVTGVGANGCTNTAVASVTVLVTPTITPVVTPTAICLGGTATLSATGATGYTWTPGTNPFTSSITVSPPIPTTYTVFRTNGLCSSTSTVNLVVNPLPLVNATASPSQICAGTGINLVVVGPITNTWLPGGFTIANFTVYPNYSTNYTVTGSNGNCTLSAVVPIIVNPSPTISISSSTNQICQGNSVTVTGNGALTYTWLPMNTNNTSEVTSPPTTTIITLNGSNSFGCTASANQLILVNPIPDMSLSSTFPFICVGQNAVLSIVNPSNMVVYNWSTGASGITISPNPIVTTSYFVTGTNTITGCTNSNSYTLSVYIATFVVTSPTAICKGETATLIASGPAATYFWNANGGVTSPSVAVSPVLTTTYNVIGTTGSCTSSTNVSIIVHPIPNVSAQAVKPQICRFEVSTITGNGATSYSWNTGASTQTISFTLSLTTTYTVTGTDVNGCSKTTTVSQFVATCIGIDEQSSNGSPELSIYPNPNNGNFTVRSDLKINLNIVNVLGQTVGTITLTDENRKEVTVSNLPNGVYFVTGQADGVRVTKKIVVER